MNTDGDISERESKVWAACPGSRSLWKSDLRKDQKIRLFLVAVEFMLLYGSESSNLTKKLTQLVDEHKNAKDGSEH